MAKKYIKKFSVSLIIREIKIKVTMLCHATFKTIIIKKTKIANAGGDVKNG